MRGHTSGVTDSQNESALTQRRESREGSIFRGPFSGEPILRAFDVEGSSSSGSVRQDSAAPESLRSESLRQESLLTDSVRQVSVSTQPISNEPAAQEPIPRAPVPKASGPKQSVPNDALQHCKSDARSSNSLRISSRARRSTERFR